MQTYLCRKRTNEVEISQIIRKDRHQRHSSLLQWTEYNF